MGQPTCTVAIFNASADTIDMLQEILSTRGCRALAGAVDEVKSGDSDFVAFMETHKPDAVIWDVAPPYERNWHFFKLIRSSESVAHCALVLTTTNKKQLDGLVGRDTGAIEVVSKPYDPELIADAVMQAIEHRRGEAPRVPGGEAR